MFNEFKKFIMRGNVVDMAVGIIIGAAFGGIVNSFVKDIIMPPIGLLLGKVDFTNLYAILKRPAEALVEHATLAQAQAAGAVTLNYGQFITMVINFIILAFAIFMVVKGMNKLQEISAKKEAAAAPAAPATKACPYCKSEIKIDAVKCPFCTSEIR